MASESFTHFANVVSGTPGGPLTLDEAFPSDLETVEVAGDGDGINGSTAIGQPITFFGTQHTLAGLTDTGDPIIQTSISPPVFFVATNDPSIGETTIGSTTTGPYLYCFAEGTRIATGVGATRIEQLEIGDPIQSAQGEMVQVKWIGRQTVSTRFGPAERLMPVRVRAGALGDGVPGRDLVLTADHALLIDGALINAGALVNGGSIDYVPLAELGDSYTVYHIETEAHDVILAEGAPAETFIDYAARRAFDNYAEYVALYGEDRAIPEMTIPRISASRMLPACLKNNGKSERVA